MSVFNLKLKNLNPFRNHTERTHAPNSPLMQSTDRRDSIDEWMIVNDDRLHSVVPASPRSSIKSHRGRGSLDSQRRRRGWTQRRSSLTEWEVLEDDNNHNVCEYLEDCNAPVQDPNCTCMTCVGFFE